MKTTRLEKAAIVARLYEKGFTMREIAEEMGISRTYVSGLIRDPDGSKDRERKRKYDGVCEDCGGRTGARNNGTAARYCRQCFKRHNPKKYWTKELVIEAIQRWAKEHGRRPLSSEWLSYQDRPQRHGRNGDGYPYTTTVLARFGSWANAIEAAGFERPVLGQYFVITRAEAAKKRKPRKPREPHKRVYTLESVLAEIRKASPWGVAPQSKDPKVYNLYSWGQRNGYAWKDLCELAGVRARSVKPY